MDQTANNAQSSTLNAQSATFGDWLNKLKAEGKTDQEIGQLLAGMSKLSALSVYSSIMSSLTEEDMKEVEAIADEEMAKQKMEELFKLRTGMTVDELVQKGQEGFVKGYLKAE
ncbi:hypothetical protein HZB78_02985 [Candidatus Collierbacteria bacterium]|nr:hypothetical protein [Candidatus Collierbacteria bacterium]